MKTCERATHLLKNRINDHSNLAEFFIHTNWQDGRYSSDEPEGVKPDEDGLLQAVEIPQCWVKMDWNAGYR